VDPRQKTSSETDNEVQIVGGVLPDGTLLELVKSADRPDGLDLMRSDGTHATIAPRFEVGNRIYRPIDLSADIVRAVNFPVSPADYGTTQELVDRVATFLDRHTGLGCADSRLAAFFVLASWFPEVGPVTLLTSSNFIAEAPSLLRALRGLCRHGLLVADLNTKRFRSLPLTLTPTIILDQTNVSYPLADLLRVSNTPELFVENNGSLVSLNCFQVVCTGQSELDPSLTERMLRVALGPLRPDARILDRDAAAEILTDLQPRLLAYRIRNFARVNASHFDVAEFPLAFREIARSLGAAIVDDEVLKQEVASLLSPRAEEARAQSVLKPEYGIVLVVLNYLHDRYQKCIAVSVLAAAVNAVPRSFGEIVEFSATEIGQRLAALGLYTSRTANAKVVRLNRETSRKAHELARRLGVPLPEGGFPDCPDCGASPQAVGKS